MNILASYNWIKEHAKTSLSAEEFAKEFSLRSMSVESIESLARRFENMVIGVVTSIAQHPNADRLRIATVDIGEREVPIVCGGTNLAENMRVLVALPGSRVRWHGGADWTTLEKAEIRGVESIGMICAPSEIGLEKIPCGDHEIWDLTTLIDAPAGASVAAALDCDDTIFDIEVTTNRPDAMGILGLAREAAVATDGIFSLGPLKTVEKKTLQEFSRHRLIVRKEDDRCERYMAAVVEGVTVGESPWWMQKRLLFAGLKPINVIVDITNYVLLELGQPMHAFDLEMLEEESLVVRPGVEGESLPLLDGKIVKLDPSIMVIADAVKPLAIAGIMGGKDSGTTAKTTAVVFEAATFNAVAVRRASRAIDVASDSQLLFEKGLSPEALPMALARAVDLAVSLAGGTLVDVVDVYPVVRKPKVFVFTTEKVRSRIGVDISDAQQVDILTKLGFDMKKGKIDYTITVPYWREDDIESSVDFTEEIARMYGYHHMPSVLPASRPPAAMDDETLDWSMWTKRFFSGVGCNEFFSNSMVSVADLEMYAVSPKDALAIYNPLSSDLTHMRPTLIPSVLRAIERNQAPTNTANIFELARVYIPRNGELPEERTTLIFGEYGVTNAEATFMKLRGILEYFAEKTGLLFTFDRLTDNDHWHDGRTIAVKRDGVQVGVLGQVASDFQSSFGIHRPVFLAEINLEALFPFMRHAHRYQALPAFPVVTRDIAVLLDEHTEFEKVSSVVLGAKTLVAECRVVEMYRGEEIPPGKKSVTLGITLMASDRTLTSQEVDDVMTTVIRELALRVDGVVRN